MSTIKVSLSGPLKAFVDAQVTGRGFGSVSAYICELIRNDQDRQQVRALLLEGAKSNATGVIDAAYFDELRARVRRGDRTD